MGWLQDESGLGKTPANHVPLTPLTHLRRAASVFATREALVQGQRRLDYATMHARVSRLASALAGLGVRPGDVVASLLPNVIAQIEAQFGVPACGAVINTINTRLDADTVGYILSHGGARVVLVDTALLPLARAALSGMTGPRPQIVEVADPAAGLPASGDHPEYEDLLAGGDPDFGWIMPQDEWESLALNYTSGTTGRPKGVVYHHRGACLMTLATVAAWQMGHFPRYLAVVPLFHCNGWHHAWTLPMLGGTLICCREISARAIYRAIADEGVTHLGGAPVVLNLIVNAPPEDRRPLTATVQVMTAGAPPPASILQAIEPLGFEVMQVYGLTETFGHIAQCLWQGGAWDDLPDDARYAIKARTGVAFALEEIDVLDTASGQPVPADSTTQGEIVVRGNCVMKGYYRNPQATAQAFAGGVFHSGDIAVRHPDGYVQLVDRLKDIIISGGENVSSVEVEGVVARHGAVSLAAVVAMPDPKWGEVPCAFVELKPGGLATEADIISHCRAHLAGFKCPKRVVFGELPKTATGKILKYELRQRASQTA